MDGASLACRRQPVSRPRPRRPCRPLTIYGYRRRPSRVHRVWVLSLVVATLVALPKVIPTASDALRRLSKVRDSALSRQPQPIPQSPFAPAPAEAEVVASAEPDTEIVTSDSDTLETRSVESPRSQVARAPARSRHVLAKPDVGSTAKGNSAKPKVATARLVRQRLEGSGLRIAPR